MPLDHFSLLAPLYDRIFHFLDARPLLELMRLGGGEWVLDVGGGTGRVSASLAAKARVIVVDESPGMLKEALSKGLDVCMARAEALPFAAESVHRVLVVDAFHHFGEHNLAAAEMMRVLQGGGLAVIEEPDISRLSVKFIALGERLLLMRSRFFSAEDLAALFVAAGGRVEQIRQDDVNFRVVIRKEEGDAPAKR